MVRPSSRGGVPVFSRPSRKPKRSRVAASPIAGASPTRPAGIWHRADMDEPAQEGPRGEHGGTASDRSAVAEDDAGDPTVAQDEILAGPRDDREIGGIRDGRLHRRRVELAVGLRAGAADGGSLAAIEKPELDAGRIRDPSHQAIEGIDLAHEVTLAEAADRGVAGHRADRPRIMRQQRGARAAPRGGGGRLDAGMTATDHDHIERMRNHRGHGRDVPPPRPKVNRQPCFAQLQTRSAQPAGVLPAVSASDIDFGTAMRR